MVPSTPLSSLNTTRRGTGQKRHAIAAEDSDEGEHQFHPNTPNPEPTASPPARERRAKLVATSYDTTPVTPTPARKRAKGSATTPSTTAAHKRTSLSAPAPIGSRKRVKQAESEIETADADETALPTRVSTSHLEDDGAMSDNESRQEPAANIPVATAEAGALSISEAKRIANRIKAEKSAATKKLNKETKVNAERVKTPESTDDSGDDESSTPVVAASSTTAAVRQRAGSTGPSLHLKGYVNDRAMSQLRQQQHRDDDQKYPSAQTLTYHRTTLSLGRDAAVRDAPTRTDAGPRANTTTRRFTAPITVTRAGVDKHNTPATQSWTNDANLAGTTRGTSGSPVPASSRTGAIEGSHDSEADMDGPDVSPSRVALDARLAAIPSMRSDDLPDYLKWKDHVPASLHQPYSEHSNTGRALFSIGGGISTLKPTEIDMLRNTTHSFLFSDTLPFVNERLNGRKSDWTHRNASNHLQQRMKESNMRHKSEASKMAIIGSLLERAAVERRAERLAQLFTHREQFIDIGEVSARKHAQIYLSERVTLQRALEHFSRQWRLPIPLVSDYSIDDPLAASPTNLLLFPVEANTLVNHLDSHFRRHPKIRSYDGHIQQLTSEQSSKPLMMIGQEDAAARSARQNGTGLRINESNGAVVRARSHRHNEAGEAAAMAASGEHLGRGRTQYATNQLVRTAHDAAYRGLSGYGFNDTVARASSAPAPHVTAIDSSDSSDEEMSSVSSHSNEDNIGRESPRSVDDSADPRDSEDDNFVADEDEQEPPRRLPPRLHSSAQPRTMDNPRPTTHRSTPKSTPRANIFAQHGRSSNYSFRPPHTIAVPVQLPMNCEPRWAQTTSGLRDNQNTSIGQRVTAAAVRTPSARGPHSVASHSLSARMVRTLLPEVSTDDEVEWYSTFEQGPLASYMEQLQLPMSVTLTVPQRTYDPISTPPITTNRQCNMMQTTMRVSGIDMPKWRADAGMRIDVWIERFHSMAELARLPQAHYLSTLYLLMDDSGIEYELRSVPVNDSDYQEHYRRTLAVLIKRSEPTDSELRQARSQMLRMRPGADEHIHDYLRRFALAFRQANPGGDIHSMGSFEQLCNSLDADFIRHSTPWRWVARGHTPTADASSFSTVLITSWDDLERRIKQYYETRSPLDQEQGTIERIARNKTEIAITTGHRTNPLRTAGRTYANSKAAQSLPAHQTPVTSAALLHAYEVSTRHSLDTESAYEVPQRPQRVATFAPADTPAPRPAPQPSASSYTPAPLQYAQSHNQSNTHAKKSNKYIRRLEKQIAKATGHIEPVPAAHSTDAPTSTATPPLRQVNALTREPVKEEYSARGPCQDCCMKHEWETCSRNKESQSPNRNPMADRYRNKGPNPHATPEDVASCIKKFGRVGIDQRGDTPQMSVMSRMIRVGLHGEVDIILHATIGRVQNAPVLIDTGSHVTLVSHSWYTMNREHLPGLEAPPEFHITVANGVRTEVTGTLIVPITFIDVVFKKQYTQVHSFIVVKGLNTEVLAGLDLCRRFFASMDFIGGRPTFHADLPCDQSESQPTSVEQSSPIRVVNDTIVPPAQMVYILVHCSSNFEQHLGSTIMCEPVPLFNRKGLAYQLEFPTPLPNRIDSINYTGEFNLFIYNPTSTTMHLKRGVIIGKAAVLPERICNPSTPTIRRCVQMVRVGQHDSTGHAIIKPPLSDAPGTWSRVQHGLVVSVTAVPKELETGEEIAEYTHQARHLNPSNEYPTAKQLESLGDQYVFISSSRPIEPLPPVCRKLDPRPGMDDFRGDMADTKADSSDKHFKQLLEFVGVTECTMPRSWTQFGPTCLVRHTPIPRALGFHERNEWKRRLELLPSRANIIPTKAQSRLLLQSYNIECEHILEEDIPFAASAAPTTPVGTPHHLSREITQSYQHTRAVRSLTTVYAPSSIDEHIVPPSIRTDPVSAELPPVVSAVFGTTPILDGSSFTINEQLEPHQREQLATMLIGLASAFALNPTEMPLQSPNVQHEIHLTDAHPLKQNAYRLGPEKLGVVNATVQQLLSRGLIVESNSPWSSPVVLVKKGEGDWRMCIDYRKLNARTRKDAYPIPLINDCLMMCKNAFWFSIIDIKDAYHHIHMADESQPMTAFVTSDGLFQWKRMPFGLSNAPATFQRYIESILRGVTGKCCVPYFDDVLVFSGDDFDTHVLDIQEILRRLQLAGLEANIKKCKFGYREMLFIGHIVRHGTILPDPAKIKAVTEWLPPANLAQLRGYLGFVNYYHKFVGGFAAIAHPLYKLFKKDVKWEWSALAQHAFDTLKEKLTSHPVLHAPNYNYPFIIQTDASKAGIAGVLTQLIDGDEHPVGYVSRQLSVNEQKWTTTEWEFLAIMYSLSQFEPHIQGQRFTIVTDHSPLQYINNTTDTGRLGRWSARLSPYMPYMTIQVRAGTKNGNADALSRFPRPNSMPIDVADDDGPALAPGDSSAHFVRFTRVLHIRADQLAVSPFPRIKSATSFARRLESVLNHAASSTTQSDGHLDRVVESTPNADGYITVTTDNTPMIVQPPKRRATTIVPVPTAAPVVAVPHTLVITAASGDINVDGSLSPRRVHDANNIDVEDAPIAVAADAIDPLPPKSEVTVEDITMTDDIKVSLQARGVSRSSAHRNSTAAAAADTGELSVSATDAVAADATTTSVAPSSNIPTDIDPTIAATLARKQRTSKRHPVPVMAPVPMPPPRDESHSALDGNPLPSGGAGPDNIDKDYTLVDLTNLEFVISEQYKNTETRNIIMYVKSKLTPAGMDETSIRALIRSSRDFALLPQPNNNRPALFYSPQQPRRGLAALIAPNPRLVIPPSHQRSIISIFHDPPYSGHLGVKRTFRRIAVNYWWSHMLDAIARYIKGCDACQRETLQRRRVNIPAGLITAPDRPVELLSGDFIGPFEVKSNGFAYVLVVIDHFSRWCWTIPTTNQEASTTAVALVEEVFLKHGVPTRFLTDRGMTFRSNLMVELHRLLKVHNLYTSAHHPQANGMVERMNGTLKGILRALDYEFGAQWQNVLQAATFAYNTSVSEATGYTPYFVMHGREAVTVGDQLAVSATIASRDSLPITLDAHVEMMLDHQKRAHEFIRLQLGIKADENVAARARADRVPDYAIGQQCLIMDHRADTRLGAGRASATQFKGPYTVIRKNSDHSYVLRLTGSRSRVTTTTGVRHMKAYHSNAVASAPLQHNSSAMDDEPDMDAPPHSDDDMGDIDVPLVAATASAPVSAASSAALRIPALPTSTVVPERSIAERVSGRHVYQQRPQYSEALNDRSLDYAPQHRYSQKRK